MSIGPHHRVLLVEDNATNRYVATALLAKIGATVDLAEDGRQAIEAIAAQNYDLVLMDMQMPIMDGLEATRRLRRDGYSIPIVGVTANAFVSDREACLSAGMNDFMTKPVTLAKLEAMLSKWLVASAPEALPPSSAERLILLIDPVQQHALEQELGIETMKDLKTAFWGDVQKMLSEARTALAARDRLAADVVFHTLTGAARTLGYASLGDAAAKVRADKDQTVEVTSDIEKIAYATYIADPGNASWAKAA
jgi:CheY-like chemotaxis protein